MSRVHAYAPLGHHHAQRHDAPLEVTHTFNPNLRRFVFMHQVSKFHDTRRCLRRQLSSREVHLQTHVTSQYWTQQT